MRRTLTAMCVAAVAGILSPPAHSQDGRPPLPPATIRVDVQMVSIPVAEAGRVIPAFLDRKTADHAWTRLQAMITNGHATLMAWPIAWMQSGSRSVFESITENRDPTEPTPRAPPVYIPPPDPPPPLVVWPTWGPRTPSAFETWNTGCTLEVEAIATEDGKCIDLNIVPQYVRRIATREWHSQADLSGVSGVEQRPEFLTSKVTTSLKVRRDEPVLIGTFVVAEPQPHVELFILHAKVIMLPAGTFPPAP